MATPVTVVDKYGAPVTLVTANGQAVDLANVVQTVNGQPGPTVTLTATDVGAIAAADMGQIGGPAGPLDGTGKVPASQLPPLQHDVGEAATEAAMLALPVAAPAMALRTDFAPPHVFMLTADPATSLANWHDTGELGAGAANPTATVGPATINGVANTYMRSDAAPAINLTASYAWTGAHTWAQPINVSGTVSAAVTTARASPTNTGVLVTSAPGIADIQFFDSSHTADNRTAEWIYFQNKLQLRFKNDAGSSAITPFAAAGGEASGITGLESDSGSGIWAHTGGMSVSGSFAINGVGTFAGSGLLWGGANVPWTIGGTTGNEGDVWTSHGNALSPGWTTPLPQVVGQDAQTAQSANVNRPNIYTATVGGMYRVSSFIVITRAATTSATMPGVSVGYTEAASGANVQDIASLSSVANTVGAHSGGSVVIACQQGSGISYSTNNYASSGATSMQYRVGIVIERLT